MNEKEVLKHLDNMYRHLMQLWIVVGVLSIILIIALAWGYL